MDRVRGDMKRRDQNKTERKEWRIEWGRGDSKKERERRETRVGGR